MSPVDVHTVHIHTCWGNSNKHKINTVLKKKKFPELIETNSLLFLHYFEHDDKFAPGYISLIFQTLVNSHS